MISNWSIGANGNSDSSTSKNSPCLGGPIFTCLLGSLNAKLRITLLYVPEIQRFNMSRPSNGGSSLLVALPRNVMENFLHGVFPFFAVSCSYRIKVAKTSAGKVQVDHLSFGKHLSDRSNGAFKVLLGPGPEILWNCISSTEERFCLRRTAGFNDSIHWKLHQKPVLVTESTIDKTNEDPRAFEHWIWGRESLGNPLVTRGSAFLTKKAKMHDRLIQGCKVNESHRCNCLQVNPPEADGNISNVIYWLVDRDPNTFKKYYIYI